MDEKIKTLYELCETISRELEDANEKIRKSGGKVSAGDVDYLDKLTHSLKSIKTTIAMMEAEDGGYSGRFMPRSYADGRSYADNRGGNSYYDDGTSYARGRNAKRDSMGRYSRDGYSRADDFRMMLEDAMESAPNEQTREKIRRMMSEM